MIRSTLKIFINNKKFDTESSLELKGCWKINGYSGTFKITDRELKIKLTAGSLLKGIIRKEETISLKDLLDIMSKKFNVKIRVEGPLSMKLFETS